jgi:hypothetical protein
MLYEPLLKNNKFASLQLTELLQFINKPLNVVKEIVNIT